MKNILILFLSFLLSGNTFSQSASLWQELAPQELNLKTFEAYKIYYTDQNSGGFWFYKYDSALKKSLLKSVDNKNYDVTGVNSSGGFIIANDLVFNLAIAKYAGDKNTIQWFKPDEKVYKMMGISKEILAYPGKVVTSDTCLYNLESNKIYVVNFDANLMDKKTRVLVDLNSLKIDYIHSFIISSNDLFVFYKEKGNYSNKIYTYNIKTSAQNTIETASLYSLLFKYKNQPVLMNSKGEIQIVGTSQKISLPFSLDKKEFVQKVFQQRSSCIIQTGKGIYITQDDFNSFKKISLPAQIKNITGDIKVHERKIYIKQYDIDIRLDRIFYTDF